MARSQIIKDFTSSNISMDIALKQLRVLLSDIGDDASIDWVKNELTGYKDKAKSIPPYRKLTGVLKADYLVGYMHYKNTSLPLNHLDEDCRKSLLEVCLSQSVSTLESLIDNDRGLSLHVPNELFPLIQKGSNAHIVSAKISISTIYVKDILSIVNNKILDILLLLEKEFGNLDDLAIDISLKNPSELNTIVQNINMTIYDNSITVGDNNKIKGSDLTTNK